MAHEIFCEYNFDISYYDFEITYHNDAMAIKLDHKFETDDYENFNKCLFKYFPNGKGIQVISELDSQPDKIHLLCNKGVFTNQKDTDFSQPVKNLYNAIAPDEYITESDLETIDEQLLMDEEQELRFVRNTLEKFVYDLKIAL